MHPNRYLQATLHAHGITEAMLTTRRRKFVRSKHAPEVQLDSLRFGPADVAAIVELLLEATAGRLACAA